MSAEEFGELDQMVDGFDLRYFYNLYMMDSYKGPRHRVDEIIHVHETNLRRGRIETILERARK